MTGTLVAVLDKNGHLTGTKRKKKPGPDDVTLPEAFDLPTDGTYAWRDGAFWPLGHGIARTPSRPPYSDVQALYAVIRHLGDDAPLEARGWADWYASNVKQSDEERSLAHKRKARR